MRICVVGGGIAGTLLALRLAGQPGVEVLLATGEAGARDATAASGGLVRGFEPDPGNARLARESLAELYANEELRAMAGYRETGSVYLTRSAPDQRALAELGSQLPGSVTLLDSGELTSRFGLAGVPAGTVAVLERRSGHISPDLLRRQVLSRLPGLGVEVVAEPVRRLRPRSKVGHPVCFEVSAQSRYADAVVLATGAWTGDLLVTNGLPGRTWRTKAIQYTVYNVAGEPPPAFVDEHSGLYGRPAGPGRMLLGLPTHRWGANPEHPGGHVSAAEERQVRALARGMLPRLRLCDRSHTIAAVDGYAADGRLCLRPALPVPSGLFTFTGGSGGAAKTALAAASVAAGQLLGTLVPALAGQLRHRESP